MDIANIQNRFRDVMPVRPMRAVGLAAAFVAAASAAQATSVTLNGTIYEIETVTGVFSDLRGTLESTPWFGDLSLTEGLVLAVGSDLGLQTLGIVTFGPLFLALTDDNTQFAEIRAFDDTQIDDLFGGAIGYTSVITYEWAVGSVSTTPVPLPASLWFLLGGGAALAVVRRNARRSPTS
jgi:hypothetical protein